MSEGSTELPESAKRTNEIEPTTRTSVELKELKIELTPIANKGDLIESRARSIIDREVIGPPEIPSSDIEQRQNIESIELKKITKTNPIRSFFNWIKHTPNTDRVLIADKIAGPSFSGVVVGISGLGWISTDSFLKFIDIYPNATIPIVFGSISISVIAMGGFIGNVMVSDYINNSEEKKRVSYSKLLTVSKVYTHHKSLLRAQFNKIDPWFREGYTGELHLVGKGPASWEGITTPLSALRDGAHGLYNLAIACENNDSTLDGITMFGGLSRIIDPQFEKFGFKVENLKNVRKKPFMSEVLDFIARMRAPKSTEYPNGAKIDTNKESYIAVISRKDLIDNKTKFARMAKVSV